MRETNHVRKTNHVIIFYETNSYNLCLFKLVKHVTTSFDVRKVLSTNHVKNIISTLLSSCQYLYHKLTYYHIKVYSTF